MLDRILLEDRTDSGSPILGGRMLVIANLSAQQDAEMRARYEQVKGKSSGELSAMGIQLLDGTYFKDNMAWLTKDWVDKIAGKYAALMDESGHTYVYPLDIPQDIMAAVIEKYGATLTKDEMIALARDAYAAVQSSYDWSDAKVAEGIQKAEQKAKAQPGNPLAKPAYQKYILLGVGLLVIGGALIYLATRKKTA